VIEGYTHKEIGTLLGISEGTSKWHLSEARKQLQQKIKLEDVNT
jgi:RNA polymerase sigma-70 factor (ECF subfamily)